MHSRHVNPNTRTITIYIALENKAWLIHIDCAMPTNCQSILLAITSIIHTLTHIHVHTHTHTHTYRVCNSFWIHCSDIQVHVYMISMKLPKCTSCQYYLYNNFPIIQLSPQSWYTHTRTHIHTCTHTHTRAHTHITHTHSLLLWTHTIITLAISTIMRVSKLLQFLVEDMLYVHIIIIIIRVCIIVHND